jgi:hypothetical protein
MAAKSIGAAACLDVGSRCVTVSCAEMGFVRTTLEDSPSFRAPGRRTSGMAPRSASLSECCGLSEVGSWDASSLLSDGRERNIF